MTVSSAPDRNATQPDASRLQAALHRLERKCDRQATLLRLYRKERSAIKAVMAVTDSTEV